MIRLLTALVIVRLLAQSTGLDLLADSCDATCEQSQCGDCSPECDNCACCLHQRLVTPPKSDHAVIPKAQSADFIVATWPPQDARAQEIFHIPKSGFPA